MAARSAFITGITGQDGAYLTQLLLNKGYHVHGMIRRTSLPASARLEALGLTSKLGKTLHLHYGDAIDGVGIARLLSEIKPDEIYNFAAQSDVAVSFEIPDYTMSVNALGTVRLLEAMRVLGLKETRFYQASTSEIYGRAIASPQNETTPFMPCSPYGVAKLSSYWTAVNYREGYGLYVSNGIVFNHESPLRGEMFVSRKIAKAVAAIHKGKQDCLWLGNLDSMRDWGHARDYVDGVWRMLQQPSPDDYVLATGESHSVREFVEKAFAVVGRTIEWKGSGIAETGSDAKSSVSLVRVDAKFLRPKDVTFLCGDASKAKRVLDWKPTTSFDALVEEMVAAELKALN